MPENVQSLLNELFSNVPAPNKEEPTQDIEAALAPESGQPINPVEAQPTATPTPSQPAEVDQLKGEIAELKALILQMKQPAPAPEPEASPVAVPDATTFLTEQELAGILDEDGQLNSKELLKALTLVAQRSYQLSREHSLRELPEIVTRTAARETAYQAAIANFWVSNSDLQPFKEQMQLTANRIAAAEPNLTINQVLEKTATETRAALNAYRTAKATNDSPAPITPSFPPSRPGLRNGGNAQPTDRQRKIDAILFGS